MIMEYREEFIAGAPRHAALLRLRTGVKKDGTIVAHEMDAYLDSGAYGGFRPGAVVGGMSRRLLSRPARRISVSRVYPIIFAR
jgi:CO/xanthine dehydrogenase Mo-binding subunit